MGTHLRPHASPTRNVVDPARYFVRGRRRRGQPLGDDRRSSRSTPPPPAGGDAARARRRPGRTGPTGRTSAPPGAQPELQHARRGPTGASQLGWGGKGEDDGDPERPDHLVLRQALRRREPEPVQDDHDPAEARRRRRGLRQRRPGRPRQHARRARITAATPASAFTSGTDETTWFEYQVPGEPVRRRRQHDRGRGAPGRRQQRRRHLRPRARSPATAPRPTAPTHAGARRVDDVGSGSVALSWTPSTDNTGGDRLPRAPQRHRGRRSRRRRASWTPGSRPTTAYTYQVIAVDSSGNASSAGSIERDHEHEHRRSCSRATMWSYKADGDRSRARRGACPGFDASSWPSGRSQLGWGNRGEATVVPNGTLAQYYRAPR